MSIFKRVLFALISALNTLYRKRIKFAPKKGGSSDPPPPRRPPTALKILDPLLCMHIETISNKLLCLKSTTYFTFSPFILLRLLFTRFDFFQVYSLLLSLYYTATENHSCWYLALVKTLNTMILCYLYQHVGTWKVLRTQREAPQTQREAPRTKATRRNIGDVRFPRVEAHILTT